MKFILLFLLLPLCLLADINILVIGDSNSYGFPGREYGWVHLLKKEYPNAIFLNYSLGGATADQCDMIYTIATDIHKPDIVIYTAGLVNVVYKNDLDHLEKGIRTTINRCLQDGCTVLFGLIDFSAWIKNNIFDFDLEYLFRANKIFSDISLSYPVASFVFLDESLLSNPIYNHGDFIHPNFEGQKIIAKRIKQILDEVLLKS